MDRDSQIEAIERTFNDAQRNITQHHSKPHVHPVEVLPIMPDYDMWKYPCAQVIFDSGRRRQGSRLPSRMSRWVRP